MGKNIQKKVNNTKKNNHNRDNHKKNQTATGSILGENADNKSNVIESNKTNETATGSILGENADNKSNVIESNKTNETATGSILGENADNKSNVIESNKTNETATGSILGENADNKSNVIESNKTNETATGSILGENADNKSNVIESNKTNETVTGSILGENADNKSNVIETIKSKETIKTNKQKKKNEYYSDSENENTFQLCTAFTFCLKPNKPESNEEYQSNAGLENLGNTCFMNSAIQCISHVPMLNDYFLKSNTNRDASFVNIYKRLLNNLRDNSNSYVTPREFKREIDKNFRVFRGYDQHDFYEFICSVLTNMKNELNDEEFEKIFTCSLRVTYKCRECGKNNLERDDPVVVLPLLVANLNKQNVTIYDCLNEMTNDKDVQEWKCKFCNKAGNCFIRIKISFLPDLLMLRLKSSTKQNIYDIKYFDELDMDNYLHENIENNQNTKYKLVAVSNHYGSFYGGHYTAYCKNEIKNNWYCFNDRHVDSIKEKRVFDNSAAYMLFYKRETNRNI